MLTEVRLTTGASRAPQTIGCLEDAMVHIDLDGIITDWNDAADNLFGYSKSEVIGRSSATLFAAESASVAWRIVKRIRRGRGLKHLAAVGQRKSGERCDLWISVRPDVSEQGSIIGASTFAREITQRERAEMTHSLLAAIVDASDDAIISQDFDGVITSWNPSAERLFGYSAQEAIGKRFTMLVPPQLATEPREILKRIRRRERIDHYEIAGQRKDGSPVDLALTICPLLDSRRRVFGASTIARDISRRTNAERELEVSNRRLEEFGRRMKRDLRAAAAIQQTFVPHGKLEFEAVEFAWTFRPCDELAGDGLNIIPYEDGKFGLYVLDVSGHGVAPALLSVAMSRILLRYSNQSTAQQRPILTDVKPANSPEPAAIGALLTELFPFEAASQQFATMTYGILDPAANLFRFIAAGHPGPVVIPAQGESLIVEATGFPIGIGDGIYEEHQVKLHDRDRLYLYSDGILEVPNQDGEQFGKERLLASLSRSRCCGLQESIDALFNDLVAWHGNEQFPDDMSIQAVEIAPRKSGCYALAIHDMAVSAAIDFQKPRPGRRLQDREAP